ncbi:MAG: hypothetical protein H7039_24120, partial [Bryobacteraceae bacterium]|nr:hypothetical protein [Bryobacteraceae bacterium]
SGSGMVAAEVSAALKDRGIIVNPVGPTSLRMVTHYDVTTAQCQQAVEAVREIAVAAVSGALA